MVEPSKKLKKIILIVGVTGAVYLILKYLLPLVIPFLLAYGIALLLRPSAGWLAKRCRVKVRGKYYGIPIGLIGVLELLVVMGILGCGLYFGGRKLYAEAGMLMEQIPLWIEALDKWLTGICHQMEVVFCLKRGCLVLLAREMLLGLVTSIKSTAMPYLMVNSMTIFRGVIQITVLWVILIIGVMLSLQEMEPDVQSEAENGNSFIKLLGKEAKESVQEVYNYSGMYLSYSLSSSTDSLKIEPYMICASENNEYVKVGMINAYKSVHWGSGIISNHQNSYLMFNERDLPQFALVTIYLQLPHYEFPNMLKGLYLCLDYNHNPIARRIVLVKQSDSTDVNQFLEMEGCLVPRAELTPELEVYYNYTCQEGDYIKTCTVPSPKLDETDLEREKKMLKI